MVARLDSHSASGRAHLRDELHQIVDGDEIVRLEHVFRDELLGVLVIVEDRAHRRGVGFVLAVDQDESIRRRPHAGSEESDPFIETEEGDLTKRSIISVS